MDHPKQEVESCIVRKLSRIMIYFSFCVFNIAIYHTRDVQLTSGLSNHLSHLMEQYNALVAKANSGPPQDEDDHCNLYRSISKLEPIAKLVKRLEDKTNVITLS